MSNRMADVREEDTEDELESSGSRLQERFGDEPNTAPASRFGWVYSASLGDEDSPRKRRLLNSEESKRELEEEKELEETLIGSKSDLEDEKISTGSEDDSEVEETDNDVNGFEIPLSAVGPPREL
ncbi:hypothetical protein DL764_010411 [Monosporascus ibericus]|uniref:Uncharacterized protein n=1 Tax=Monosporascus ibericus TaxID=155417 RepID=A0A4Q4SVH0_9PEZI|nr:hypothetical protein DL764_010411 [Monosporascus ibericus]